MNPSQDNQRTVAVVGGGITGLAAAYRLKELDPQLNVVLLEASSRVGGVIDTLRRDEFLIERGADSFLVDPPWALRLCERLGLADQLISTSPQHRGAYILCGGRLEKAPQGFALFSARRLWPILATPLLSPRGKLRVLAERFVRPRRDGHDESLASFARRRLGQEAFERLVQPLVSGIYTADPERLSMAATLPRFQEMERRYGSLRKGALAERTAGDGEASAARYHLFVTPQAGMAALIGALAERLNDSIRLDTTVEKIERTAAGSWKLSLRRSPDGVISQVEAAAVVMALPAYRAADLLAGVDAELARELSSIDYAPIAVVSTAYQRDQVGRPLEAFGMVVPAIERRQIVAASFSSVKFPGRAPDDAVLIRTFVGGACQASLAARSDEELRLLVRAELDELLAIRGEPLLCDIARWPQAMPQYHVGHLDKVARIEQRIAELPGLALAGNAYRGVGIPHCIHSGETAAEKIVRS